MHRFLNTCTIVDTNRIDQVRRIAVDVYDARSFEAVGDNERFSAKVAYFDFGSTNLTYAAYGSRVRAQFRDDDFVRVQTHVSGHACVTTRNGSADVRPDTLVCTPAEITTESDRLHQLALRIDPAELERDLSGLLGTRPKDRLSFDLTASCVNPQTKRLQEKIFHTAGSIGVSSEPIPAPLLREIDQTIRLAVLYGIPNNYTHLLTAGSKSSAPWQIKRIEEWIDAHWKEDITIEKLTEISGASARSIHSTFKNARGYTPMSYLKKVRLNVSRNMLLSANPGTTVTGVGIACHFLNTGHFANDYQRQFGELPSETLRRARTAVS